MVCTMRQTRRILKVKAIRHVRCERWSGQPSASGMSRQPLHTQRHTLPELQQCFCKNETHTRHDHSVEQFSFAACVHSQSADSRTATEMIYPRHSGPQPRTKGNWTVIGLLKQIFCADIDWVSHELLSPKSAFTLSRSKLRPTDCDVEGQQRL